MKTHRGLIKQHQSKLSMLHRVSDVAIIFGSLALSCLFYGAAWEKIYTLPAIVAAALMVIFSAQNDLYRSWRVFGIFKELMQLYAVWAYVVTGLLLLGFMLKTTEEYSRLAISTWFLLALPHSSDSLRQSTSLAIR